MSTTARTVVAGLMCLALATLAGAQLSGNYTIDPNGSGPTNYTSFLAATAALNAGVSGPVFFQVASTTFREAVMVSPSNGTSATNTVTFLATGSPAIIDATGAQDGLTVNLACRYYVFENLEVRNMTRYALHMNGASGAAGFCTFKNCKFDAPATTSTSVRAATFDYCNDCTFENCLFAGGGYTAYSQQINRCVFRACEFDGKNLASYVIAPFNSNDANNLWENCFFHSSGPSGHGLYFNWSSYGNAFFHNVVIVTSTNEATFMGSCCAWTRAQCWRNNIIVNLGTGPATVYGCSSSVLDYNDLDCNCYWAPNATLGAIKLEVAQGGFSQGTLAQWKTFLAANPGFIPAGGGTNFDQNSIEADPQLLSMTPPYDIHLKGSSPCVDAGTTTYVPGVWITGLAANYVTAVDFEGDPRPATLVDIGADEMAVQIVGSGSGQIGTILTYSLLAGTDAGLPYQVGNSLGNGPIVLGNRKIELALDDLLVASTSGNLPAVFQSYSGLLDAQGQGTAKLAIPNLPVLKGLRIHAAFVTLKATAPLGISNISNTFLFTIQ